MDIMKIAEPVTDKKPFVIAVDFDGVICEDTYPKIGKANNQMIEELIAAKNKGVKLILWTCRRGIYLNNAVSWCRKRGLEFDAVNENLPEHIEHYRGDTRKVFADLYIDDKSVTPIDYIVCRPDYEWAWNYETEEIISYQNVKIPSLFMHVNKLDNTVTYKDVDRVMFNDVNENGPEFHTNIADRFINTVYPISFPYNKEKEKFIILGTFRLFKANVFYIGAIRKPDGTVIDVDQHYIYEPLDGSFKPISDAKARKIFRKLMRREKKCKNS